MTVDTAKSFILSLYTFETIFLQADRFLTTVRRSLLIFVLIKLYNVVCTQPKNPIPKTHHLITKKLATDYIHLLLRPRTNPDAHAVRGALSSRTNTTEHRPLDNNYCRPAKSKFCALKFHQETKEFLKPLLKKMPPLSLARKWKYQLSGKLYCKAPLYPLYLVYCFAQSLEYPWKRKTVSLFSGGLTHKWYACSCNQLSDIFILSVSEIHSTTHIKLNQANAAAFIQNKYTGRLLGHDKN